MSRRLPPGAKPAPTEFVGTARVTPIASLLALPGVTPGSSGPELVSGSCKSAGQNCKNNPCCAGLACISDSCVTCTPSCSGKTCGSDGCGGSCGTCLAPSVCSGGACVCTPSCTGKSCGTDGCGGSCGTCAAGFSCNGSQQCVCNPACVGKNCGPDGCGGSCGTCAPGTTCSSGASAGICVCAPSCAGKSCGDDGCGGSCGTCAAGTICNAAGACLCTPSCTGKVCGTDGCGGSCGTCAGGTTCNATGTACTCTPNCGSRTCGDDGCGGSCGMCSAGTTCNAAGACVSSCAPSCAGKVCGNDGCSGSCGTCPAGTTCNAAGTACTCTPNCVGKACGDDGCGGSCGTCTAGLTCNAVGSCAAACTPSCAGKTCGSDGCGGSCGTCAAGETCAAGVCTCTPDCTGKACGPDGCGGSCGSCAASESCSAGKCACVPSCSGKACGPDGCGGVCGSCAAGQTCSAGACTGGSDTSLPGSGTVIDCTADVCNPYCHEYDSPGAAGVTPPLTATPGATSYHSVGLGGVPGGFVKKGNREPCTSPGDCNFDYHCDVATGTCVGNQTTHWFDPSCAKADFTIGLPCGSSTFPMCNRGSKKVGKGSVVNFYRKNGGGNMFGQACYPAQNCGTFTLQDDLLPGDCIDIGGGGTGDSTNCFHSGNNTIYVNATDASGKALDECTCDNNWTDQKGAATCTTVPPASSHATLSYDTVFTASCPAGTHVRWGYMAYDTTPASNASGSGDVLFTVQTGDVAGGPYGAIAIAADTPNGSGGSNNAEDCALTGPLPCPIDLYAKLGAVSSTKPVLHLSVTMTPTPDGLAAPVLDDWKITFSCVPSE